MATKNAVENRNDKVEIERVLTRYDAKKTNKRSKTSVNTSPVDLAKFEKF